MDRICINCKYLNSDWHVEPCRSCVTRTRPNFEANNGCDLSPNTKNKSKNN